VSKYQKRDFRIGEWYLGKRGESPAFYRCRYANGRTERVSLGVTDFDAAKRILTEWYYQHIRLEADRAAPERVALSAVLDDYWHGEACKRISAPSIKILLRYWREFWVGASVADVRDVGRQEEFQRHLAAKGLAPQSVNLCLDKGRAAIRRAWKRGVISSPVAVMSVNVGKNPPKGRPLSLEELKRFVAGSDTVHWRDLALGLIGTGARPNAILTLTRQQIDFEQGLLSLNPEGREQTNKYRPTVRLPALLAERWKDRPEGRIVLWRGMPVDRGQNVMRMARKRAKLDKSVNLYSFRHTCARWMRAQGVDAWQLAAQLGHRREGYDITELYAAYDPAYLKDACAALSLLLEKAAPDTRQAEDEDVDIATLVPDPALCTR